jgi:hypothetical protein
MAKDVSALLPGTAGKHQRRRNRRYHVRGVEWKESRLERVRKCGRVPTGSEGPAVKVKDGIAHYSGLQTCGSIWACPVCSAHIRAVRANEIAAAAGGWSAAGNSIYMVTLTMPHDYGMRLAKLLPVIADGFRSVLRGRPWLRLKADLGIVGTIRAVEVTFGENGWHPHLHVLVFIRGELDAHGLVAFDAHIRGKWTKFIVAAGYREPDAVHGVVIKRCHSAAEAGLYVAKTQDDGSVDEDYLGPAMEVTRSDLKEGRNGHRTPFELLGDFADTGDRADLEIWHEYERATQGHQAITWSKGLRALLVVADRTDDEIVSEEIGGDIVMMIASESWRQITGVPGLPAYVLDQAEAGGRAAIIGALARYGIDVESDP